ncbi:MAG: pilus assembly protein PilM [Planctomycetota bacterium]
MTDREAQIIAKEILDRFARRARKRRRVPAKISALDLDGRRLRVVTVTRRGKISEVHSLPLGDWTQPASVEAARDAGTRIRELLSQHGVRLSPVVMGVPRGLVVLKPLRLPATRDANELASMVQFRAAGDLPFPSSEAIFDFTVQYHHGAQYQHRDPEGLDRDPAEGEGSASIDVLVAAIRNDVLEAYRELANAAGFKFHALGLRSYANVRCVEFLESDVENVALLSVRPDEVMVDVVDGNALAFSRSLSVHVPHGDETENLASSGESVDEVALQGARSLRSFAGAVHAKIHQIYVAGDSGHESAIAEAIGEKLSTPAEVLDLSAKLDVDSTVSKDPVVAGAALGLAIGASDELGLPFDFLTPKKPAVSKSSPARVKALVALILVAAFVACLVWRSRELSARESAFLHIQTQITQLQQRSKGFKRRILEANELEAWENADFAWLDIWAHLSAACPGPEDIYVTNLSTSPQGVFRMGIAAKNEDILQGIFLNLRAAGYKVDPMASVPSKDRYGYPFRATLAVTVRAGQKLDVSKIEFRERPEDDMSAEVFEVAPTDGESSASPGAADGENPVVEVSR